MCTIFHLNLPLGSISLLPEDASAQHKGFHSAIIAMCKSKINMHCCECDRQVKILGQCDGYWQNFLDI